MAVAKSPEEFTLEDRIRFSKKVRRLLLELTIDQENEKLRKQGADYELVLVCKDNKTTDEKTTG